MIVFVTDKCGTWYAPSYEDLLYMRVVLFAPSEEVVVFTIAGIREDLAHKISHRLRSMPMVMDISTEIQGSKVTITGKVTDMGVYLCNN